MFNLSVVTVRHAPPLIIESSLSAPFRAMTTALARLALVTRESHAGEG